MSENFSKSLPKRFVNNTLGLCGESGEQWLNDLPTIIGELSANWSLQVGKPFSNLSYNFVAPCFYKNGNEAVLKIALPLNNPEIFNEAKFLQMADGKGIVEILSLDKTRRAMLLEKLTPGENLKQLFSNDPAKSVETAIKVLQEILQKSPNNSEFLRLEDWFNNFFERSAKTDFPREFLDKTKIFFDELNSASKQKYLIHGDFHHENILSATRESFLAIDPKGIIGEVGYEIAVFLNNHLWWLHGQPNYKEKLNEAVGKFSEAFLIPPIDLQKWAFCQIVLSAWWTFEENNENWKRELAFTENWKV